MLYRIWKGTVPCEGGQRSVVYLVSSVEKLQELNIPFVFSDGHGLPTITRWYDDLADLDRLDWEAILSRFWSDTPEDPDRCRRKQAELLVLGTFPWEALLGIGVLDEPMRRDVEARLAGETSEPPYLGIKQDWYYVG